MDLLGKHHVAVDGLVNGLELHLREIVEPALPHLQQAVGAMRSSSPSLQKTTSTWRNGDSSQASLLPNAWTKARTRASLSEGGVTSTPNLDCVVHSFVYGMEWTVKSRTHGPFCVCW
jgi:hypothetical protein